VTRLLLAAVAAGCSACAPLKSAPPPEVGPPEYAYVLAARELDIRAGETRAERAAWATLSLDPAVVAAAVVGVEGDFGRSQLFEYDLDLVAGGTGTIRSRYIVEPGQCVLMRRLEGVDRVIIVAQEGSRCTAASASP
jgi:hypothetical protein